ncbi:MAG: nucleoside hydrolase [Chloroflexi bacterium]|nr:nucleoside hydrolase [Chloroflexota bacterium]
MSKKVICDCDNTLGAPDRPIDDGQTLLYLLGREDIDLVGITTTFGNGTIEEVQGGTEWFVRAVGCSDIPLIHGVGERQQPPTEAAHFLADTAARYPGEVSVLAIGPLGNLRGAYELDSDFFKNVREIAIMGGYLQALPIPGWEHVPERNLSSDPEAAQLVLDAECPVTLMNAQICLEAPFGLDELAKMKCWQGTEIYEAMHDWLRRCIVHHGSSTEYLWDLLPAIYLSRPDLFDNRRARLRASVADMETGALVSSEEAGAPTINMPAHILDLDGFYQTLYDAWEHAAAHYARYEP